VNAPVLLVVGASVRAWAASAHRAGWRVVAADLFADRDLERVAEALAIPAAEHPGAYAAVARDAPPGPWCYCGALENHPDLVDTIAASRPLAGCPGSVLRHVRDPWLLRAALADSGFPFPATRDDPEGVPLDGSWLVKPLAGAGGRGIVPWEDAATRRPASARRIWQERVAGSPVSASFVVDAHGARLVGSSRQLVGVAGWHAAPFAWCGAVDVPLDALPERTRRDWERVGAVLAGDFGVTGAVGVDAIAAPDGSLVVLEVNPRPTASMELVERRTGVSLAAQHLAAHGWHAPATSVAAAPGGVWAKGVLRARSPLRIDEATCVAIDDRAEAWRRAGSADTLADLPRAGVAIPAGGPVLTVLAAADDPVGARAALESRVAEVEVLLAAANP